MNSHYIFSNQKLFIVYVSPINSKSCNETLWPCYIIYIIIRFSKINSVCMHLTEKKKQYKDKECDDFLLFLTSVCLLILRKAFHIAKYIHSN